MYKLQKLKDLKTLQDGHHKGVLQLERIDDSKMLSVGLDKQVIVWNMITMQKLFSMDIHESVWRCAVIPGKLLLGIVGEN